MALIVMVTVMIATTIVNIMMPNMMVIHDLADSDGMDNAWLWFDDDGNHYQQLQFKQTNPDYWVDTDGIKEYNNRIDNGFRLFGKYYRNLWD